MIGHVISTNKSLDDKAFIEDLYLSYKHLIYSEIHKIVENKDDVEEITHDVIVKLIGKLPKLRGLNRDQRVNYIIVAARNTAKNFVRDHSRMRVCSLQDETDWLEGGYPSGDDWMLAAEREADLMRAWRALDERSRRILELKYILDESNETIAAEFGVKPDSVRMLLSRAKRQLRELLDAGAE